VPAAEALPAPSPPPADPCTAAALAHTVSGVASAAGAYLDTHSGANDAVTRAGTQTPDQAESSLRDYFKAHPGEYDELRDIAKPLSDMRVRCNQTLTGGQIAALVQIFNAPSEPAPSAG